ncbi:MAG TPA: hypothetical protein VLC92_19325 [Rhodocyclaceae bacterium]|nr:hypothetical protein [Rhodocyclaceae bacterium]
MSDILTPKDIINILVAADGAPSAFTPWNNKIQKVLFIATVSLFLLGFFGAVSVRFSWLGAEAKLWILGLVALSQIMAVIYQITIIIPSVKMFGDPAKTVAEPAVKHFDADIQAITELATTFEQHHLDYARDRLAQVVEQMKFRVGFMLGAIDKVGIFPSAITGYFYAKEILSKPDYSSSGLEWVFGGLVALYIAAVVFMTASQRIERLALVAKHAAARKLFDSTKRNG